MTYHLCGLFVPVCTCLYLFSVTGHWYCITNLEHDWPTIRCPTGKGDEIFWHIAGASRREHFSALGLKVRATGSRVWVWDYRDPAGIKRRRSYGSPEDGVSFDDAQRAVLRDRVAIGRASTRRPGSGRQSPAGHRI